MPTELEDRLRHLELEVARQRDVLDRAPSVSYTRPVGSAFALTSVTENVRDLSGHPPDRLLESASLWPSLIHPEDRARVLRGHHAQHSESKRVSTEEYRVRDPDGVLRWVRDTWRVVRSTDSAAAHVAGCWLDITAEKEWEDRPSSLNADFEGHVSDRTKMLVHEAGEHRRTRDTLQRVIASARCLLWEADVEYVGGELHWRADLIANEAGSRVLSLVSRRARSGTTRPTGLVCPRTMRG